MVELRDLAGGKADLVAVAGIACRGGGHELALREFALKRLGDGNRGVGSTGHAHGLVDVATARKRVADGAADAGRRATKGLDLSGVVVRLVLKEEQPVLVGAIHIDSHLDGAGVDLLRLVQASELAGLLEILGADGTHVHQADGLLVAAQLVAHLEIAVKGLLHGGVIDRDVGEHGAKGGVAAVVRPVGVDHADLGDGRVALLAAEVLLAKGDVGLVHGKAALGDNVGEAGGIELTEALEDLDGLRFGGLDLQGVGKLERGDTRLDGVHYVVLDGLDVRIGKVALEHIDLGGAHVGALALADELHALGGGVGTLVKLAGQELHGEHGGAVRLGQLVGCDVYLRLREDRGHARAEQLLVDALDVVAVDDAQAAQGVHAEDVAQLALELLGFNVKTGLLLHIDARDH